VVVLHCHDFYSNCMIMFVAVPVASDAVAVDVSPVHYLLPTPSGEEAFMHASSMKLWCSSWMSSTCSAGRTPVDCDESVRSGSNFIRELSNIL